MPLTKKQKRVLMLSGIVVVSCWPFLTLKRGAVQSAATLPDRSNEIISPETSDQVSRLIQREEKMADTLWADEMLSQRFGRRLEGLWDEINDSSEKLASAASQPLGSVMLGDWNRSDDSPLSGVEIWRPDRAEESIPGERWMHFVHSLVDSGWILNFLELRHVAFKAGKEEGEFVSSVHLGLAVENTAQSVRAIVDGPIEIVWSGVVDLGDLPAISRVDCRGLEMRLSRESAPFRLVLEELVPPPENAYAIDPLIVSDLDRDGRAEIILAGKNLVFRSDATGCYRAEPLCTFPPGSISTALLADIDLDGAKDLICVKHEGMVVLPGSHEGIFDQPERLLWGETGTLKYPMVLSGGDFDRDGDIDLFLGQYRVPYEGGSLPTPFHDANDGFPFYLFRNDGDGGFVDVTDSVGLSSKRYRRVYSASLVDIDGENGPDLVVVSDFAGVDLYLNEGNGTFVDRGSDLLGETHGFGMAHLFSDFNADGKLDFLMVGMTSPTVARLESLGLWRGGLTNDRTLRSRMTYGTRLFLSGESSAFIQNLSSDSIARSGWAWGCSAADFNNDGYADVFIGNGLESRDSVRDYESEYWLHDAFVANSEPNSSAYLYFKEKFQRTRGRGHSYGGYEYDRLYLNQNGDSFLEVGHPLGVSSQRDSRNVVTEDLNRDGRIDLLVTSFEHWPKSNQTLRIYLNELESNGNWIGFRVDGARGNPSSIGVQVVVRYAGREWINENVTGDSYRSQHSSCLHFGLGSTKGPATAVVRWPDGLEKEFSDLPVNGYYRVTRFGANAVIGKE
ncbi:CRTAC1 family protein [Verrucomicrobia bacterium]|nr:CRTAC1 family protein [Verrucomicrobiota bacterium]MDA7645438.1 CRTAC1 family protein [bacterium]MDB4746218.1 CRTAC1 family protein [Verrucomicrobiota bacterium]MDB4798626.1 CRTAC1 family protein [Verrucomicrobiota bacterium]